MPIDGPHLQHSHTLFFTQTRTHTHQAVAASGDTERARFMINDAFQRAAWDPPNVQSYDALLSGMVQSLKTGASGCSMRKR